MEKKITVNRYDFKYDEENEMYECCGEVCYDDEHDEMPEPNLWHAALTLAKILREQSNIESAEAGHSEKGWVEVHVKELVTT